MTTQTVPDLIEQLFNFYTLVMPAANPRVIVDREVNGTFTLKVFLRPENATLDMFTGNLVIGCSHQTLQLVALEMIDRLRTVAEVVPEEHQEGGTNVASSAPSSNL